MTRPESDDALLARLGDLFDRLDPLPPRLAADAGALFVTNWVRV